jgi:hypothetical protein
MPQSLSDFAARATVPFHFRPWVRRAGASIVLVAAAITVAAIFAIFVKPSFRFGWFREPFVWVYIGTLWLGGAKILGGTFRPIAEVGEDNLVLRPLHQFFTKRVLWSAIRGTEQLIGGDRLILYYETVKGMRFVALNLNLVKGRRDFLTLLDRKLESMGFAEKVVSRSRYLSKG